MIYEVMRYCRNFFAAGDAVPGDYQIKNGGLNLTFVKPGQFFFIDGSSFNDGVYEYPAWGFRDETFSGYITPLNPPQAFIDLAERIKAWREKNEGCESYNYSPFTGESFGGYSYSKGSTAAVSWMEMFRSELAQWRRL